MMSKCDPFFIFFLCTDKAAADANAAAWAAYYAQYGQQPQASMTPASAAPGTAQPNGQGETRAPHKRVHFQNQMVRAA